jgi:hypothetical protein
VPTPEDDGKCIVWRAAKDAFTFEHIEGGEGGPVPLSGDVEGTTAAAKVTKVRGRNVPVPGGEDEGKALIVSGADYGYQALPVVPPPVTTLPLAGDVTGATGAVVVEKIRGKTVPGPGAGEDEKVLTYDHDAGACVWATPPATPAVTMGGDVAGSSAAATVEKIRGRSVPLPGATEDEKYLKYDHDTTSCVWATPAGGPGGNPVVTTAEVNLGSTPRRSGRFTLAGTGMTVGKPVMIQQATGPYTGKGTRADEAEMDQVSVTAKVLSATVIEAFWQARGRVRGSIKFDYFVAG